MKVDIRREWCKGCGICVAFCPKGALRVDQEGKAEHDEALCVVCGMCERYCPDLAITVARPGGKADGAGPEAGGKPGDKQ